MVAYSVQMLQSYKISQTFSSIVFYKNMTYEEISLRHIKRCVCQRFGRRTAALAALISHAIARLITAFSINYYMFVFGRFLLSVSTIGWYTTYYLFGRLNTKLL